MSPLLVIAGLGLLVAAIAGASDRRRRTLEVSSEVVRAAAAAGSTTVSGAMAMRAAAAAQTEAILPELPSDEVDAAINRAVGEHMRRPSRRAMRRAFFKSMTLQIGDVKRLLADRMHESGWPAMTIAAENAFRVWANYLGGWVGWETRAGQADVPAHRRSLAEQYLAEFNRRYASVPIDRAASPEIQFEVSLGALYGAAVAIRERANEAV